MSNPTIKFTKNHFENLHIYMDNNVTQEQFDNLKRELEQAGIHFYGSFLTPVNSNEYISYIFSHITIPEIEEKIANFQKIDLDKISDKDLDMAIADVMNIEVKGQKMQIFLPQGCIYPAGTRCYRMRIVNTHDLDQFSNIGAYWNPPKDCISKSGRLNKVHESLLYTSLNYATTFSELKIQSNQTFALIVYEALEPIKMNIIGADKYISELSENDNRKYQLYNKFLREEFTKEVQTGFEHYYRVSEYIAKYYFDLPARDIQDAWMYPSVASSGEYNICFRPDIAKEVLKFVGVIIGRMIDLKECIFQCLLIGTAESGNSMSFTQYNSTLMEKLFPEFIPKNDSK